MLRTLRAHLTYANVMSTIAVVTVIGGGTAVAASRLVDGSTIKRGTVRGPQLASNSVDSTKVRNGSLLAADFKRGQLPVGATGATGPAGAPGAMGAAGERGPEGPAGKDGATGPAGVPDTSQFYDRAASDERFARRDAQVVHVSGAGTPASNGTALLAALAAITPPTGADHPVMVVLGPGAFDLGTATLQLVDWVSIAGASAASTTIRGTGNELVHGASSELLDLTLQHDMGSGGPYVTITLDTPDTMRFTRSELLTSASGGGTRTGVATSGANVFFNMRDSRILVRGGVTDTGVTTSNSTLNAFDSSIEVLGSGTTHAIRSSTGGGVVAFGSRVRALSGASRYAVAGGGTASVVQFGSSEVYGTLDPVHTYYCGGTFDTATYLTLPPDCIV